MKASDFLRTYAQARRPEWEARVVDLARRGELAPLSWIDVPVSGGGRTGVVRVSSDVLTVGEPGDVVRMPLTAPAAQAVLNVTGDLLPTRKLAVDINQAVRSRVQPVTYWPNPGSNLESFARHSRTIDQQIASIGNPAGIVGGHKKDLVVSNKTSSGKEAIYGWYATQPVPGVSLHTDARGAKYIQPLSDVHDHNYVDYSHGVRAVFGTMIVDGREMQTEDVYRDPALSVLVSDEGPIKVPRYDARTFGSVPGQEGNRAAAGLARVYSEGLRGTLAMSAKRRSLAAGAGEAGTAISPWLALAILAGVGVGGYFLWKRSQPETKKKAESWAHEHPWLTTMLASEAIGKLPSWKVEG